MKPTISQGHDLKTRLRAHVNDRALEWFSASIMLAWSLVLALPGQTLAGPSFAAFNRFDWMTEALWAWVFGVVGAARIVALYINGRWPKTPHIRMAGSLFGALSWAQVAWLITEGTYNATGVASTGTAVYTLLALADIFSIYRARFDARYYRP
jgi:hypothetical protein